MERGAFCEIQVKGSLDARWSAFFEPLALVPLDDGNLILGTIRDQSELFGLLLRIRDMGLELMSVKVDPDRVTQAPQPAQPFPVLTTERLLLRAFNPGDAPAVLDILGRPEVNEWLETDTLRSPEEAEARVRSRMRLFEDGMGVRWAIALRDAPARVIGSCGYFSVRRGTQTYETGYELHPDYWNQGLITEALRAILRFGFDPQARMPVHRMEALVIPDNGASVRVLEKLGFSREGMRREFGFWKGRYQDVALYALLNEGQRP
jgi:[ribosomal protein S5]-alanine N-acetyltransferase